MNLRRLGDVATVLAGLTTSGTGAGARPGDWSLREVSLRDIEDDRINVDGLESISVQRKAATEKHLLRPFDVLVTARSTTVKCALVPPSLDRAVANATLAIVRPTRPDLGPLLWWYFSSERGKSALKGQMVGARLPLLRASNLLEVEVPVPSAQQAPRLAALVELADHAYRASIAAATLRRDVTRALVFEEPDPSRVTLAGWRESQERRSDATHQELEPTREEEWISYVTH